MIALLFCILSIPDGSILFTENGSRVVANKTDSSLTHSAIVLNNYVYESRIPKVNKIPLEKYLKNSKYKIIIAKPKTPYSKEELKRMIDFAESQLEREYSVRSFVKGHPKKTLHCSEYVCEILIRSERYESISPSRVTPGSLWESIKKSYIIE